MNWKEIKLPKLWRTKGAQYALCAAVMAGIARCRKKDGAGV